MYKIAEVKKPSTVPQIALRLEEIARAMGISTASVRKLVRDTDIPVVRLPNTRVMIFPTREVTEWLSKQVKKGGEANG